MYALTYPSSATVFAPRVLPIKADNLMQIIFCDTFIMKFLGLMFTRKSDQALVFRYGKEQKVALHMFFVFYPIDVVYLDSEKRIVELKPHFRPFHIYFPVNKACYVLELPAGYIQEHALAAGNIFTDFSCYANG